MRDRGAGVSEQFGILVIEKITMSHDRFIAEQAKIMQGKRIVFLEPILHIAVRPIAFAAVGLHIRVVFGRKFA